MSGFLTIPFVAGTPGMLLARTHRKWQVHDSGLQHNINTD